jgi:hypothetical protein
MPHATPVIVHRNIGLMARKRRLRETPQADPPAKSPPTCCRERSFGGPAGCPNVTQPELQIVNNPLLGLAAGDGKGERRDCGIVLEGRRGEVRFGLTASP